MNIWQPLAGIVFFMMGSRFMEKYLRRFAGRNFKLWLKGQSGNKWKSLLGGSLFSAVMQSSSAVNLLVLTFIGSGIFTLEQALVWILGSNIGANITGWILLFFGFSVKNGSLAFIFSFFGGIAWLFVSNEKRWHALGGFLLGLGLMLNGLMLIKEGMGAMLSNQSLHLWTQTPDFVLLLSGLLLTAVLQSSAATLAILLTMLHLQGISFVAAAFVMLGAEIGTSVKLWFAAWDGSREKKRLAMAGMLYNVVPVILIFPFLRLLIDSIFIGWWQDRALIGLVIFQTLINVLSAFIFLPFIGILTKWLRDRFNYKNQILLYMNDGNLMEDPFLAMEAFRNEVKSMYADTLFLFVSFFNLQKTIPIEKMHRQLLEKTWREQYDLLKEIHGHVWEQYLKLQSVMEEKQPVEELEQMISVARNCMYAAKSLKDILEDRNQLMNSSNNRKYSFYMLSKEKLNEYLDFFQLGYVAQDKISISVLQDFYHRISRDYETALSDLYGQTNHEKLSMSEISTLVNFNRELAISVKSLFFACKSLVTDKADASDDENFPGFIR